MFRRGSTFREVLEMIVLTIAIFLVVRVALQNFRVEGDSMNPTLQDAEYILVNKVDYFLHSPERGDIVVFHATPAGQPDKDFIKRIVGLPGDVVQVKNGGVYINARRLPETSYQHTIPDYNWGPESVPSGDYFVLGDNRNNSEDSHLWKWLPRSDIIGKAWISYWPLNQLHLFQAALTPPLN
jgi:signal peptidase I